MNSKDPATSRQSGVNRDSLVPFAAQIDLLKEEVEERDHPGSGWGGARRRARQGGENPESRPRVRGSLCPILWEEACRRKDGLSHFQTLCKVA